MIADLPVIGITMGDAAGIGPEIVVKALADKVIRSKVRPLVIGDASVIRTTIDTVRRNGKFSSLDAVSSVEIVDLENLNDKVTFGENSAATGKAAGEYIEKAVELWKRGEIDAICTAPINKASLNLGGYDHPGHTEFLAALSGTEKFAMSFFAGKLRVVLLSTHMPLIDAVKSLKRRPVAELIRFTDISLSRLLDKKVTIAVAGLNPHASENGKFGSEEKNEISPAIAECRSEGIEVSGPYSPDTIFLRANKGEFDVVIALYHDQATIAVKALSFGSAVNVTLGLPFVRTSVDHGTAFDIAGKGIADPSSMKAAIELAAALADGAASQR